MKFNRDLFWEMWDYMEFLSGGLSIQHQSDKKTRKLFDSHGNLLIHYKDIFELNEYFYDVTKLPFGMRWSKAQRLNPIDRYRLANGKVWHIGSKGFSNE